MRLESPWLLLLEVLVGLAGWYLLSGRRREVSLWFPSLGWRKSVFSPWWHRFPQLPRWLFVMSAAVAVLALARPQVRGGYSLTGEGADFMIVLDMSVSMNAVDMSPQEIEAYHARGQEPPNRFELAIDMIKKFIATRQQDRVGLVVFARRAYLMFPPTLDYDAILEIIDGLVLDDGRRTTRTSGCINGCTIEGDATAIGDALAKAYNRLKDSNAKSKNIILITDGANNAGKIQPQTIAKYISQQPKEKQAKVYSFLVGDPKYTFVPVVNPFTNEFVRGPDGMLVYDVPKQPFDINPELLQRISKLTGGKFFRTARASDFKRAFSKLVKTKFKLPKVVAYKEAFEPLAWLALVLLALGGVLEFTLFRRFP